jgi:superfamily II DNA or RNA helicase
MPLLELSANLLAEIGGWAAMKEARALVERGKVGDARREGNVIRARVQGAGKTYEPQIVLAERVAGIEVRCTCVESRRTGRVCAHALAAGLAVLQPAAAVPKTAAPSLRTGPKRWLLEEAPAETALIEVTILLPLQLEEALGRDPVRIILEGRRGNEGDTIPWDALMRGLAHGFATDEADARVLDAVEAATGSVAGVNAVARDKSGSLLRALADHPRVWLGKKQRIEVQAADRPEIKLHLEPGGAIHLKVGTRIPAPQREISLGNHLEWAGRPIPSRPSSKSDAKGLASLSTGWSFDGEKLIETATLPPGFSDGSRLIPREKIPEFLTREWPLLEKACDLVLPPGFDDFVLETGRPTIEARLEGALSGLTLDLVAHYGDRSFPLGGKSGTPAEPVYFPDPNSPHRFWRRDEAAEKAARVQAELAGFKPVKSGAAALSLIQEKEVARFLANALPRWRRTWKVTFGPRLESAMREIDVAEPEFSLRSGSGEDWLSLDLKLSVGGKPVPLDPAEIQRWLQTGQNHARTANKRVLLVPTEAWGEMREVLADCAVDQEPGKMRVPRACAPFLAGALTAEGFRTGENALENVSSPPVRERLDPELWRQLRPYQMHGVEWLAALARQKFHGLLADDMGLGKTLQALAFGAWLRATDPAAGPILVVCPTSLVTNWLREAARFVPHLRTLDLTGTDRADRLAKAGEHDLLVTSYAILRRDGERYRAREFSLVILDEAQHIKNRGSQNAQAAKALRARRRLILTGTPLENSVLDLWSLFDFLLPGYLGTAADFRERYETPLARGVEPRTMERLRHRVRPFFLRRTKEEVLPELPPKLEHLALCELSGEQREVYQAVLAQGRRDVFEHAGKAGRGRDRLAVLTTLLRLRQVCCHLDLLPSGDEKRAWKEPSAKLERTFELIDEAIDGGHRVLLFSQFVRALHLLRDEARRRGIAFCYLDGQTVERQAEVDRFQRDAAIPLFLISLKAGGTGLNLTGADTVIHFDPWWNPAVEEQATARAHRLGQARRVQAYKLIAAGTVEEKIQALQARKRDLFAAGVGGGEAVAESLTGDELEELLTAYTPYTR